MTADRPATEPRTARRRALSLMKVNPEWVGLGDRTPEQYAEEVLDAALAEAAPRAEGLAVERLAEVMWDTSNAGAETPWVDVPSTSVRRSDMLGWAQAIVREYARLSRPSDERVPESEDD